MKPIKEDSQCGKVLRALREAEGGWINGRKFLHELYLSQYHARIFELQRDGYKIEASDFKDEWGFVSYRLVEEPKQQLII